MGKADQKGKKASDQNGKKASDQNGKKASDQKAKKASDQKAKKAKSAPEKKTTLRNVVIASGTAVALGVTGFITASVTGFLDDVVVFPQPGDPVEIRFVGYGDRSGEDMALSPGVPVDDSDITALNAMTRDERMSWFEDREASRVAPMYLNVVLTGNRNKQVRVMDIQPVSECVSPAEAGTLFVDPPAGGDDSILLSFDLDAPKPRAMVQEDTEGGYEWRPYFENHTVSLSEDEQQVFQIELGTKLSTCSVFLDFSILDGSELKTQRLSRDDKPFRVTASLPYRSWQQVYVGGVASCVAGGGFAPATEAWLREDGTNHCE